MTESLRDQVNTVAPEAGLGIELRAARVDKGLSADDVANALHLTVHTVEAIENGCWEDLPPGPFRRGYVRLYAGLLVLDADPLIRRLDNAATQTVPPLRISGPVHTAPQMPRLLARGGLAVVVGALVGGAGWWALDQSAPAVSDAPSAELTAPQNEGLSASESAIAAVDGPNGVDDDAVVAGELPMDTQPAADAAIQGELPAGPLTPAVLGEESAAAGLGSSGDENARTGHAPLVGGGGERSVSVVSASGEDEVGEPEALQSEREQVQEPVESVPVTAGGEEMSPPLTDPQQMVLEFGGPSWMEVTDARGERLLYGLVQERGERVIQGEAPFSVVIGDVTQVGVVFADESVDLGPREAGRVVRLEVP